MNAWVSNPIDPERVTVRRRAAALLTCVLLGTGVGARALAQDAAAHAGGAGVVVTRDVMVPMRDGVRLATDVYRPRSDGGAAHALAMAGDAHLKTVIPIDAVSDMGYHGLRNGGAFELRFFNWIFSFG